MRWMLPQWVVVALPSSRPALASRKLPVQTLVVSSAALARSAIQAISSGRIDSRTGALPAGNDQNVGIGGSRPACIWASPSAGLLQVTGSSDSATVKTSSSRSFLSAM